MLHLSGRCKISERAQKSTQIASGHARANGRSGTRIASEVRPGGSWNRAASSWSKGWIERLLVLWSAPRALRAVNVWWVSCCCVSSAAVSLRRTHTKDKSGLTELLGVLEGRRGRQARQRLEGKKSVDVCLLLSEEKGAWERRMTARAGQER